nr:translation initiation factor IF-2 [Vallitaleaceae bacterium]
TSNANRPSTNNQNRSSTNNTNRPATNNANRPSTSNANRPATNNQNRSSTNNTNRPAGSNTNKSAGSTGGGYKNTSNQKGGYKGKKSQSNKPKKSRAAYRKEKRDAVALAAEAAILEADSIGITDEDGVRMIEVPDRITVKDLSLRIGVQVSDVIKVLFTQGIMTTANQEVDFDLAVKVADEFDVLAEKEEVLDILETFFESEADDEDDLVGRSPVVVVMGHVDHGKTSLLDAIRDSSVTTTEHGGITQHIGASVVTLANGHNVTFLDTPGHEAFTAMRLRGALATDIAILVVAADDGVMPQTIEAINHAKAAGVQIIIAINKVDKPGANIDRVKQELIEHGLVTEDWGGDTIAVPVSAIEKTNLDQLLEMVTIIAEVADLKANPNKKAKGIVIESSLDKGRGPVATVLVQEGTLKVGDSIVAGVAYGRIRAMFDDLGDSVKAAGPSKPVEVLGLSEVPMAGETFYTAKNEREARHVAEKVQVSLRERMIQHTPHKVTLDDLFTQIQAGEMKELKLIIKADVQGSVEAVKSSLLKLSNEEVMINIIHGGVGAVNESDVMLASASNAIIIGFNVRPENSAKDAAEREEIDIRLYRVIYNAIDDIESAMKGMLDPIFKEKVTGFAEVRQTFAVSNVGTIAGSYMKEGKIARSSKVRVIRGGVVVFEGDINSLKRFKDDVKEVATGYECGIMIEKFNDVKEGDIIEGFIMEEIPR